MDENLHELNQNPITTYMPVKQPYSVDGERTPAAEEWTRIVNEFNNTEAPYPKEKTLFGIFEEQVLKTPDAIALRKGDKTLTYNELNKQANRLANLLIDSGIVPEDNIGLLVTRDFEMIIGMMAILKSGGAYVPIDPEYPIDRQEYIFNQSLLKMVIADRDYPLRTLIDEKKFIIIDFNNLTIFGEINPGLQIDSKQLAYTIYTSGSTGRPKGVMIEHHSAVNLVLWVNSTYNVGTNDRLLFITSMCFDLSVYDVFGMLSAGGTLVIAESKEIQNVRTLQEMLVKYDITFWDSVPTTMDYLVRDLEREQPGYRHNGLKTVFMSGDWIPVDLPERMKAFFPEADVISLGGATEATVWSNYFPVKKTDKNWKSIPYGKPITNNFFYILDEQLQPVPFGVMGDLYIGGVGVARGYANDPEKTNNAFVPDPFNKSLGGVMYRTGDLGRMMPDLNMEFLGRKDNQVKIQGFRIELGEVESVLNSCEIVRSAVVLAKDDIDGKKMLVAYIVPKQKFDKEKVVEFLKTKLPQYMVPAVWIEMEDLPLTSNGKIDRKSLPDHQEVIAEKKKIYLEPNTETEKVMAALWKESMGLDQISVDDNFFELGGHSLMAVRILSKFEKKTGRNFQLAILFKYPDIRSLSDFIDNFHNESIYTSLVPIKPSGNKPPLYIIHGEGLNILNFSHLATYVDPEQPIFGLQAKGLNSIDEPLDNLPAIAGHYLNEILQHNPNGPYLIAGYSFGGYVAVEMRKQLADMGKQVKMLMMFDTNAEKTEYKDWYSVLPKKVRRHLPRIVKSLMYQPVKLLKAVIRRVSDKIAENSEKKRDARVFYQQIKNIKQKHLIAFRKYPMVPFDDKVYLYRADICVHYVNDPEFLGWKKFAKKGVELYHIPGDHLSMLLPPNVKEFASILQKSMDDCV